MGEPSALTKPDGVGALQFSTATYVAGPSPNASLQELTQMLREFASHHGLGEPHDERAFVQPGLLCSGASYQSDGDLIRAWYLSDGRSFALATYVCRGEDRGEELAECEEIVAGARFDCGVTAE